MNTLSVHRYYIYSKTCKITKTISNQQRVFELLYYKIFQVQELCAALHIEVARILFVSTTANI